MLPLPGGLNENVHLFLAKCQRTTRCDIFIELASKRGVHIVYKVNSG